MTRISVLAVLAVAAMILPHVLGAVRGVNVGRAAVRSHRQSVKIGVRMGRWQMIAFVTFGLIVASKLS